MSFTDPVLGLGVTNGSLQSFLLVAPCRSLRDYPAVESLHMRRGRCLAEMWPRVVMHRFPGIGFWNWVHWAPRGFIGPTGPFAADWAHRAHAGRGAMGPWGQPAAGKRPATGGRRPAGGGRNTKHKLRSLQGNPSTRIIL